jgi:enoyl-CoA hydratase/carnithine racemase
VTDSATGAPEHGDLDVTIDGTVATLTITRPPHNYFDLSLIQQIADTLERLAAGGGTRAVILHSDGRSFCAGARLGGPPAPAGSAHLYDHAIRIFEQPLPIIAAVHGAAIGGGFGLALAADFRVAGHSARFAANFAQLGFHHGFGLTETLPLVAGHQTAIDLLYTGRSIDATEAFRLGICDRLVDDARRLDQARLLAEQIASSAPLAVRSIRETMRGPLSARVREALTRERAEQSRLMTTDDWREGVAAAAQRRAPSFVGH